MLQRRYDDKKKVRQVKREAASALPKKQKTVTPPTGKTIKVVKKGNAAVDHFSHLENTVNELLVIISNVLVSRTRRGQGNMECYVESSKCPWALPVINT
jgi:hypothetical protein